MKKVILYLIYIYRTYFSPFLPPSCRFYPTCSQYAQEAITRYGLIRGGWLSIKRLSKCHPFHAGGYDPVELSLRRDTELGGGHRLEPIPFDAIAKEQRGNVGEDSPA